MIEKKTIIDQIEITRGGTIQIRFAKCFVEDGKIIGYEWHRTTVDPGVDVDAQLAVVDIHLPQIGAAPITDEPALSAITKSQLKQVMAQIHTPELVAKYKADLVARRDV